MLWKKRRQAEKPEEMSVRHSKKKETWENSRQTIEQKQRAGSGTCHNGRACHGVFKFWFDIQEGLNLLALEWIK